MSTQNYNIVSIRGFAMGKRIAVVTGASSGLGKEWLKLLVKEDLDEVWAIARRKELLDELAKEYPNKVVAIPLDLTKGESLDALEERWNANDVDIVWMINNAGMGKTCAMQHETAENLRSSIHLNVEAVAILSYYALKHMRKGSHLINTGSQAGRQPLPYLAVYASGKAFVNNWSAALHYECKKKGIHVMAVTPAWIYTDMLKDFDNGRNYKWGKITSTKEAVVQKAYKDAKKGKIYSINKSLVRAMVRMQKILPESVSIKIWEKQAKEMCDID